ncbi:MAG: hypothetical protein K0Q55_1394, partial [Verrucomicrobia bacterium]|nr:hypothetical protein [Verrucomicrobiota bacterium]
MTNLYAHKAARPALNQRQMLLVAAIVLLGAAITYIACHLVDRAEKESRRNSFQRLVESRIRLFESAGVNYEELLFSLRNIFIYDSDLTEKEFTEI